MLPRPTAKHYIVTCGHMPFYGVPETANTNGRIRFGGRPDETGIWMRTAVHLERVQKRVSSQR